MEGRRYNMVAVWKANINPGGLLNPVTFWCFKCALSLQ